MSRQRRPVRQALPEISDHLTEATLRHRRRHRLACTNKVEKRSAADIVHHGDGQRARSAKTKHLGGFLPKSVRGTKQQGLMAGWVRCPSACFHVPC